MRDLTESEIKKVNAGFIGIAIGVVGGLIGIYEFGKAIGRLMKKK